MKLRKRTVRLIYRLWSYPGVQYERWFCSVKDAERARDHTSGIMNYNIFA